jgi:hypothetical protein
MVAALFICMKRLNCPRNSTILLRLPLNLVGGFPSNRPPLYRSLSSLRLASVYGSSPSPQGFFPPLPRCAFSVCEEKGSVGLVGGRSPLSREGCIEVCCVP